MATVSMPRLFSQFARAIKSQVKQLKRRTGSGSKLGGMATPWSSLPIYRYPPPWGVPHLTPAHSPATPAAPVGCASTCGSIWTSLPLPCYSPGLVNLRGSARLRMVESLSNGVELLFVQPQPAAKQVIAWEPEPCWSAGIDKSAKYMSALAAESRFLNSCAD